MVTLESRASVVFLHALLFITTTGQNGDCLSLMVGVWRQSSEQKGANLQTTQHESLLLEKSETPQVQRLISFSKGSACYRGSGAVSIGITRWSWDQFRWVDYGAALAGQYLFQGIRSNWTPAASCLSHRWKSSICTPVDQRQRSVEQVRFSQPCSSAGLTTAVVTLTSFHSTQSGAEWCHWRQARGHSADKPQHLLKYIFRTETPINTIQ